MHASTAAEFNAKVESCFQCQNIVYFLSNMVAINFRFLLLPLLVMARTRPYSVNDWSAAWIKSEHLPPSEDGGPQIARRVLHDESKSEFRWCHDTVSQIIRFDSMPGLDSNLLGDEDIVIFEQVIFEMERSVSPTSAASNPDQPCILVQEELEIYQGDDQVSSIVEIKLWYTVTNATLYVDQISLEENLLSLESALTSAGFLRQYRDLDPPILQKASMSHSDECISDGVSIEPVGVEGISNGQHVTMQSMSTSARVLIALASILVAIGMTIIGLMLLVRQERIRGHQRSHPFHGGVTVKRQFPNADTGIPLEEETRA